MAATKQLVKAKKNWYPVLSPPGFGEMILGEAPVADLESLKGRHITVNLMTLTNDPKHQNISVSFKVATLAEGRAITDITGYETSQAALKRFVRRDISRMDDSFVCETSEGKQIRIKVMLLTKTKTTSSVLKSLRSSMIDAIAQEAAKQDYESFLKNIIYHKMQGAIRDALKKIYPLRGFEVKKVELTKKPGARIVRPKKAEQKEEKRRKKDVKEEETSEE